MKQRTEARSGETGYGLGRLGLGRLGLGRLGLGRLGATVVAVTAALGGGVTTPGCAEFDTAPPEVAHGTLGEEIVQVFCERIAREANPEDVNGRRWKPVCAGEAPPPADAPPRLSALMAERERLAGALDATLPEGMHDDLGLFVNELLPFFDRPEERLPTSTRRLAALLERLSSDEQALAALERIGARQGYRPLRYALGVTRPTLAYPRFDEFADVALVTLLDGPAREELIALLEALALEMATLEPGADEEDPSTLELTRRLLFAQSEDLAAGPTTWVLERDPRGIAAPLTVAAPFTDADGDGLADVDALGRFVDAGGAPAGVPAPFRIARETGIPRDSSGRALRTDGTRYFRYFDASQTMLAGLTAELSPWLDPERPTLLQATRGVPVLLGPRVGRTARFGAHELRYAGFDLERGPALDAVAAVGELLHRERTVDALVLTETLVRDHESQTAGLLHAVRYLAERGDAYPDARLTTSSNFWDDVIDVTVDYAEEPGLTEAMLRSFTDPRAAQLGEVYGQFMRYRDRVTYDPAGVDGPPEGLPLDEPVDHGAPDTFDNESLVQRSLALIQGLDGVQVCNREGSRLDITVRVLGVGVPLRYPLFGRSGACDIVRIDNVAEAYALAILGDYELELQSGFLNALTRVADALGIDVDAALEQSFGIEGLTRRPTPEALSRLVFWGLADSSGVRSCVVDDDGGDCNSAAAGQLFEPVRDRHGDLVVERYHGTIFAWESPGFFEGMTPLLEVLHRPGYRYDDAGRYRFGRLIGTLHQHWASPANTETCGPPACAPGDPRFSYQSDARSYEALLADGMLEGELIDRLVALSQVLDAVEVRPGVDGLSALAATTEELVDPARNPGLTDRRGRSTTTVNDGSREVPMTPLYMLLDALAAMDDAWAGAPERRREFLVARRAIAEQLLAADTLGEGFAMRNRRARAMLLEILPFARERIAAHRADGDLYEWSTGWTSASARR